MINLRERGMIMKVDFNLQSANRKMVAASKFKGLLTSSRTCLRTLIKDIFEKTTKSSKIIARKAPNWCQTAEDIPNKATIKLKTSFEKANAPLKEIGLNLKDFVIK